jgi:hypothetical protein
MGEGGRCEDGSGRRNGRGDQKKVQRNGGAQGSQGSREDGWMFEPRCFFSSFGSRESRSGYLCVALSWTGSLLYAVQVRKSTCLDLPITETGYGLGV